MANQVKKQASKPQAETKQQTAVAAGSDNNAQATTANDVAAVVTSAPAEDTEASQGEALTSTEQVAAVLTTASEPTQDADLDLAEQTDAVKTALAKALKVIAKVDKFRRGGLVFDRTETTVHLADLTDEQIKQIKEEPLLVVTEVEVEVGAE